MSTARPACTASMSVSSTRAVTKTPALSYAMASWVPAVTNAPSTPLSTATTPAAGARITICGCTKPPWIWIRPTGASLRSWAPCWPRQLIKVPVAGAFTEIWLPSTWALSVVT